MRRVSSVSAICLAAALGAGTLVPSIATAQQSLAYVLGNERYGAERLEGPSQDALAMSRALIGLGFDVIRRENTSSEALALGNRAADTVVLYFSGRTETREGKTYLMGAQLGDAPTGGWPVVETAQKFRASGARNVLVFVQNCYADADSAVLPPEGDAIEGIMISYGMSPDAECAALADDDLQYSERLLAALDTPGVDVVSAFEALPGSAMLRNGLSGPVVLGAVQAAASDVTVTSDAVVISAPVNTAVEVTAVSPVTFSSGATTGGTVVSGAVQAVSFTPISPSSTSSTGVQIFNAAPRAAPLAAVPTAAGLPQPSIIVGALQPTNASFTPTTDEGALSGTGLDGGGFEARQQIKAQDSALYVQLVGSGAFDPSGSMAVALQTELQRMNCYTGRIDGDFGSGSRRSVRAYFTQIGETAPTEQATVELFRKILLNDEVTCPVQVQAAAPRRTTTTTTRQQPRATARQPARQQPARPAAPRQAPASSGGINTNNLGTGIFR